MNDNQPTERRASIVWVRTPEHQLQRTVPETRELHIPINASITGKLVILLVGIVIGMLAMAALALWLAG